MKFWRILVAVLVSLLIVLAAIIYSSKHEIIEGAWVYKSFISDCEVIHITYPLQPFDTTVIACPYTDLIRIWPLPIVYPWNEDWWEIYKLDELIGFSDNGLRGS